MRRRKRIQSLKLNWHVKVSVLHSKSGSAKIMSTSSIKTFVILTTHSLVRTCSWFYVRFCYTVAILCICLLTSCFIDNLLKEASVCLLLEGDSTQFNSVKFQLQFFYLQLQLKLILKNIF